MAKFMDETTSQEFAAVHASIHNHFNWDRTSTAATSSSKTVRLHWPSGVSWQSEIFVFSHIEDWFALALY